MRFIPIALYRATLRFLQSGAPHHGEQITLGAELITRHQSLAFEQVDAIATKCGEVYRGLGILVGVLGAFVLLLTILPHAWPELHHHEPVVHLVEFVLMVVMTIIVVMARVLGLKKNWIEMRLLAEHLRYAALAGGIERAEGGDAVAFASVQAEVKRLLGSGTDSQIRYNELQRAKYEHVEHFVDRLTYYGFGLSLLGAVFALALDYVGDRAPHVLAENKSLLLLLTALVPALVATFHGVVSFLHLPQLIMQHERMVSQLVATRDGLPADSADAADPQVRQQWLKQARLLLNELRKGDSAWSGIARQQEVRPH